MTLWRKNWDFLRTLVSWFVWGGSTEWVDETIWFNLSSSNCLILGLWTIRFLVVCLWKRHVKVGEILTRLHDFGSSYISIINMRLGSDQNTKKSQTFINSVQRWISSILHPEVLRYRCLTRRTDANWWTSYLNSISQMTWFSSRTKVFPYIEEERSWIMRLVKLCDFHMPN